VRDARAADASANASPSDASANAIPNASASGVHVVGHRRAVHAGRRLRAEPELSAELRTSPVVHAGG